MFARLTQHTLVKQLGTPCYARAPRYTTNDLQKCEPDRVRVLARTDAGHVMVLGQVRKVFVELFDSLLVRFDTLALQAVVELWRR